MMVNGSSGWLMGMESEVKWQATEDLRLTASYTHKKMRLTPTIASNTMPNDSEFLRSQLNLPNHVEFDTTLYHVGRLKDFNQPSYRRLDVRLGWRPRDDLELSLVGQNLTSKRHVEMPAGPLNRVSLGTSVSSVPRSAYARLTWNF